MSIFTDIPSSIITPIGGTSFDTGKAVNTFVNIPIQPLGQPQPLNNAVINNLQTISAGNGDQVFRFDEQGIWLGAELFTSAPFSVDMAGILRATGAIISGTITATTGFIGGWTIGATSITDTAGTTGLSSAVTGADDIRLWAGDVTPASAEFRVYESGALVASSATITGAITATSGSIGSFTIGTYLYTGTKTAYNDVEAGVHLGSDGIGIGNNIFTVSSAGALVATSATITGAITATSGTIGSFTIGTYLYTGTKTAYNDANAGVHLGSDGIGIGNNVFTVSSAGALVATSATITGDITATSGSFTGSITATSGTIGGFTITATELYGGIIKTAATVGAGTTGVIMDTDGLRGYDSVLGETFNLPTDGSAPTFASGVINTTIFNVSSDGIIRTSTTVGDGTASSAGILINNTGLYATEANQTLANANVKILIDGSATIKMNVKGGQTDYNTGTGYFLGLSAGDYKLSVGNPAANHLTFDGTELTIKGSFEVGSNGLINNSVYTVANLPIAPTTAGFEVPSAYE